MTATTLKQTTSVVDPLRNLQELTARGLGHPATIRTRLKEDDVPVEILDGRGTIGVRESNVHLIRRSVRRLATPASTTALPSSNASTNDLSDLDRLALIAAKIVSTWPRLSAERKAELTRLLSNT